VIIKEQLTCRSKREHHAEKIIPSSTSTVLSRQTQTVAFTSLMSLSSQPDTPKKKNPAQQTNPASHSPNQIKKILLYAPSPLSSPPQLFNGTCRSTRLHPSPTPYSLTGHNSLFSPLSFESFIRSKTQQF